MVSAPGSGLGLLIGAERELLLTASTTFQAVMANDPEAVK